MSTLAIWRGERGESLLSTYTRARVDVYKGSSPRSPRLLDLALKFWCLGYSPIPLGAEKKPLVKWRAWRVHRPSQREVEATFGSRPYAKGIALICGKPHNLTVLDADDEASASWLREHMPGARRTLTRRGLHVHFRHPSDGLVTTKCDQGGGVELTPRIRIDVKAFLSYVVAPGSLHPSGFVYQAEGDWTSNVAELQKLPARVAELCRAKPIVHRHRPRHRRSGDDAVQHFENYLRKRGGIPPDAGKGSGSDSATFRAASYAKRNIPELDERQFVAMIKNEQPYFDEKWIASKWRSARGK